MKCFSAARRWLAGLLALALLLGACGKPYELHGSVYKEPRDAPELALTDHNGQPFQLNALRGNVVLLFFGYTHCPDVCPTTLADLMRVRRDLGADGEWVKVVFVSVDPERDTTDALKRYVTSFDESFIGLRGAQDQLDPIMKDYKVKVVRTELPNSALGYAMDHSAFIYVIDKEGQLREKLLHGAVKTDEIAADVRYMLQH